MLFRISTAATLLSLMLFTVGCADSTTPESPMVGDSDEHGEHGEHEGGHPETFAEAFAQLSEIQSTVSGAFEKEDMEAAHGPLHEVGHLLEDLSSFAAKSELGDEEKKTIETNIETLFDAFGAVDKKMHDDSTGKDYSEVSDEIDTAIKAIATAAGEFATADVHHDDDEGHGDHGEEHAGHDEDGEDGAHGEEDHDGGDEHAAADAEDKDE